MNIALAFLLLCVAPAAQEVVGVAERKDHIPDPEKPVVLNAGRRLMLLVAEAGPIMGPNLARVGLNTLVLSASGGGYRWCFLSDGKKRGPIATGDNTRAFGVTNPYTLVEVDVQEGSGSPNGTPPLVVSTLKVLDGSKEFPLQPHKIVDEARTRYGAWLKEAEKDIAPALEKARVAAGGDAAKAKPARTATLMYVTWMEATEKLQVRFLTRVQTTDDVMKPSRHVGELARPDYQDYWGVDFGLLFEAGKTGLIEKKLTIPMESWKGYPPRPLVDWRDFPAASDKR